MSKIEKKIFIKQTSKCFAVSQEVMDKIRIISQKHKIEFAHLFTAFATLHFYDGASITSAILSEKIGLSEQDGRKCWRALAMEGWLYTTEDEEFVVLCGEVPAPKNKFEIYEKTQNTQDADSFSVISQQWNSISNVKSTPHGIQKSIESIFGDSAFVPPHNIENAFRWFCSAYPDSPFERCVKDIKDRAYFSRLAEIEYSQEVFDKNIILAKALNDTWIKHGGYGGDLYLFLYASIMGITVESFIAGIKAAGTDASAHTAVMLAPRSGSPISTTLKIESAFSYKE